MRCQHQRRTLWVAYLQWRIFAWFGLSIVVAAILTATVAFVIHRPPAWVDNDRMGVFIGERFADTWKRADRRDALAQALSDDFHLDVALVDPDGQILFQTAACEKPKFAGEVALDGEVLGEVRGCPTWDTRRLKGAATTLGILLLVLWLASGLIARRVAKPIRQVVEVARRLGEGDLKARVRFGRFFGHEAHVLGDRINEMASRIERQIGDQRELLAVVSHELRTPLGHLRILAEIAEESNSPETLKKLYGEFNQELDEIEGLVGELLASARLDFANLDMVAVASGGTLIKDALHRAGLEDISIDEEGDGAPFLADKVLVARALANLIANADKYAGGVTGAQVITLDDEVRLEIHDDGPGMNELAIDRAFEPFARGGGKDDLSRPGLGLGLSLVRRIAEAHGGRAYLEAGDRGLVAGIALPIV